jgi:hypothetical protein
MASSSSNFYSYSPLPVSGSSIRILTILPDFPGAEINCRLDVVSLESAPKYKTLSYAWGLPEFTETIFIKGLSLRVTKSLFVALQNLRDSESKQIFWIDAICINQLDVAERNAQVKLMTIIYANASFVVIWLGQKDHDIDKAWDLLERWKAGTPPRNITEKEYVGLTKIFQTATWWKRLWVVQEIIVALNAILQCSNRVLDWNFIAEIHGQIEEQKTNSQRKLFQIFKHAMGLTGAKLAHRIGVIADSKHKLERLENFIENWSTAKLCTDGRDVIYVMLNIVPLRDDQPKIIPDYNKSVYEVYLELTRHMLVFNNQLSALCNTYHPHINVGTAAENSHIFTSWSIDWSRHRAFESLLNYYPAPHQKAGTLHYSASGNTKIDTTIFSNPNLKILTLHGVIFDTIVSIEPSYSDRDMSAWQSLVRSWKPKNLEQSNYPTGEEPVQAYVRTLFRDMSRHSSAMPKYRLPATQINSHILLFNTWSTGSADEAWDPSHRLSDGDIRTMKDFVYALAASTHDWCFFVTSKGYFGLAQTGLKTGDAVVVVDGACTPLVFRGADEQERKALVPELESERKVWRRASAAYVHGIMDGEMMRMVENGAFVKQEILLI